MGNIRVTIKDESFEMMYTIALVHVINHWDEFVKEMGLNNGPDGDNGVTQMYDEICHHTAEMLYDNDVILSLLIKMWGEEKTLKLVHNITNHKH